MKKEMNNNINRSFHAFHSKSDWTTFIVNALKKQIDVAIDQSREAQIILPGGTTPAPIFEALAKENLPWEKLRWWLGDERFVGKNNSLRNECMLEQSFGSAWEHILPRFMSWGEELSADIAAQKMHRLLTHYFPPKTCPDFTLLGLGDDGHTASLFPSSTVLQESQLLAAATSEVWNGAQRLTFTLPFLNKSTVVCFAARGQNKRKVIEKFRKGDCDLVASRVLAKNILICWDS